MSEFYPGGLRENHFSNMYCNIAMENYFIAEHIFEELKSNNYSMECVELKDKFDESIVSSIVFSAMCIESFLNNYLAAILKDSEFYNNYDNLRPINKIHLITTFIYKKDLDKSIFLYSGINELFKLRNIYVHNKSKHLEFQGYLEKEMFELENLCNESEDILLKIPSFNSSEICADLRDAFNALKSIKALAKFIDENDNNAWAMINIFGEYNLNNPCYVHQKTYKQFVFNKLDIKGGE